MTTYAIDFSTETWRVRQFEMRIVPNLRTFTGPYTPTTQTSDLAGERWAARFDLVSTVDPRLAAAREAFFDRLKGQSHLFSLWHAKHQAPRGTMRGSPVLAAPTVALANTSRVTTTAGATVRAGDMLGVAGQLIRVMADATADGAGLLVFEHQPRARVEWAAGAAVTWDRPTANFMLRTPDGVPTVFSPGYTDGVSVEAIEVF